MIDSSKQASEYPDYYIYPTVTLRFAKYVRFVDQMLESCGQIFKADQYLGGVATSSSFLYLDIVDLDERAARVVLLFEVVKKLLLEFWFDDEVVGLSEVLVLSLAAGLEDI